MDKHIPRGDTNKNVNDNKGAGSISPPPKVYTEEDMRNAYIAGWNRRYNGLDTWFKAYNK